MGEGRTKQRLSALQAHSLRELVEQINRNNLGENKILKEDIVQILKENEIYILLYYC
jgi:hypothetical protein